MTEEEIASLFERAARDLDVPRIEGLVTSAERSGRRLRRRHRGFLAAGVVLAAGEIVAGTTTGVVPRLTAAVGPASPATGLSATPAPTAVSTSPSSAPSRTASVSPSPAPSASSRTLAPSLSGTMTATQIMDDPRPLLPATSTIWDVQDTSSQIWSTEAPSVEFNYNDGQGQADVQVRYLSAGFPAGRPGLLGAMDQ